MTRVSQISIFTLLLVLLAAFPIAAQKAGPVRFRMTLLSLYEKSDLIFIGRLDKKEDYGTNRVGNGFTVVTTKTYFDVSTVLKGETRKFIVLDDEEFRYQIQPRNDNEAPREAVFIEDIDSYDADAQPKPGDTVLAFVSKQGDAFELTDQRDGLKKISPQDAAVYSSRISELNSIFMDKPEPEELAEWLVRCAEEPVTRWDGAHELLQGFRRIKWQEKATPKSPDGFDPLISGDLGRDAARNLTAEQKTELTQILLRFEVRPDMTAPRLSAGDRELISLVKLWDTSSVANYLAAQLRSQAFSAHENAGFMFMIAELLGDAKAASLARRYADQLSLLDANGGLPDANKSELQKKAATSFLSLIDKLLAVDRSKNPC